MEDSDMPRLIRDAQVIFLVCNTCVEILIIQIGSLYLGRNNERFVNGCVASFGFRWGV